MRVHNSYRTQLAETRFQCLKEALVLTEDESIIFPSTMMIEALVKQLKALMQSITIVDKEIEKMSQNHPDFFIFDSLPRAGHVFVPRLIVAFGSDRNRYPITADLQTYSGIAPVLERSGKKSWGHGAV